MKTMLLFKGLALLLMLCPITIFSQGGTSLTSPGTGITTLPFNATGSTVGAGNQVNDADPGFVTTTDNGPDWVYMFCPSVTTTYYITVTFAPGGVATPVLPSISMYYNNAGTWTYLGGGTVTGDVDQTVGATYQNFPAGMCLYVVVDGANTTGYNYNINVTSTPLPTQTLTTQPGCTNMGFDNGTSSGWTGNWGHSILNGLAGAQTPVYTPIFGTTNTGHHNVTTGGLDTYVGVIPQVCPLIPGNTNSLMLGDGPNASYGGAQLMQKFSVTASNALLTYYYAAVMQDAGSDHANYEQPFFKIEALDCSGNPITCGNYLVTGGPGIPGFIQVGTSSVYYKDWTPVMLDLTPYIGSCVTIKFTIGDCARGAHFAYAYLDATCGPLQIVAPPTVCQYTSTSLTAPSGAASYSWVNTAAPGTVLSTSNPYTFTPTTTGTATYQCTMTNVAGCNSTVSTTVTVNPTPQITITNPPAVCTPNTVDITSGSVVTVTSGSGTISYYSDAACTVPIASPNAITTSGTYYIKILNANGCYEVEPVTVTINQSPSVNVTTADQTICIGQSVNLNSTLTPAGVNVPVTFTNTADFNITDASVTATQSPITVSGVNPQTAGVLPIVSVNVNITHTYDEDITIWLKCPNGSTIELTSQNGVDGNNYTNTVFVPTGAPSITTGTAPFTGNYTPEQAFSLLNACAVNGIWTLMVYDLASGDVGTLTDWSITFNSWTPTTFAWSPTTNMTNSTTLNPTVSPTATTTYTLTGTNSVGACTASDPVTITVNPLPTATVSGTASVCQNGASPVVTFTGNNGAAPYTFTYNINGGANQTVSSGAGSTATLNAPTGTVGTFTYNLVSVTSAMTCSQSQTGSAVITVMPLPTATISGTTTVCLNAANPNITFNGSGGTAPYTFTYTINGGPNQTVTTSSGNSVTVSAPTSSTGTFTYALVSVSSANGCSQNASGNAVVTVNPLPTATISGTTTVCQNGTAPVVTFTGSGGSAPYTFTYNINGGTNQTVSSGAGNTATVTAPTGTAGTFTYNLVSVSIPTGCPQSQAGSAIITINPLPTATLTGTTTVCQNAATPTITFTGANGVAPYTFTYNINGGANQTVSSGAGTTATITASTGVIGTFTYNLVSVSSSTGCNQNQTGSAVVTVNGLPTATIAGTTSVCQNATSPNITFTGAGGTAPYIFTYTINGGANQTVSSGAGNTATVPVSTATVGAINYDLVGVSSASGCSQVQTGTAVVTILQLPTATISGTTTVCQNAASPVITFTGANGTAPYTFTYNINGGTNQTVSSGASSTTTVNASTGTPGSFTYNLVSVSSANTCSQTQTGTTVITVDPLPTATVSGATNVCQNAASPNVTFTGAGGVAPYTFTYTINGGTNQTVSTSAGNSVTVAVPTGTTGTFTYSLVSVSGANGCAQPQVGNTSIVIEPAPSATISGTTTVCQNATSPVITITGSIGSAPFTFVYTLNGGANQTIVSNAAGVATISVPTTTPSTYTYDLVSVTSAAGCSQNVNGSAVVSVNPIANATITGATTVCQNDPSPVVTFTGSSDSPSYTFTYNINGGASTTVVSGVGSIATVNVSTASAGTFTYNLTNVVGVSGCPQTLNQSVSIVVSPTPTASVTGTATICEGETTDITITGTPNATVTYNTGGGNSTVVLDATGSALISSGSISTTSSFTLTLTNVQSQAGCSAPLNSSVTVTINPIPVATALNNIGVCAGSTVNVPAFTSTPAGATFGWTNSTTSIGLGANGVGDIAPFNGQNSGQNDNVGIINFVPTLNGCVGNPETFTITIHPIPVANAGTDVSICEDAPLPTIGSAAVVGNTYQWTPATGLSSSTAANPQVQNNTPGTTNYVVTVTSAFGCVNTDNVQVTFNAVPIVSFVVAPTEGCSPLTVTFTNTSANSVNCVWNLEGVGIVNNCGAFSEIYTTPGTYDVSLTITDANGCSNSLNQSDIIKVYPQAVASFDVDAVTQSVLNPEFHFTNTSLNATTYSWNFGDGATSTAVNPIHVYAFEENAYTVQLTANNEYNCPDVVSLTVNVTADIIIYVPNTFTPDGDEHNNTFYPVLSSGFDKYNYTLYIFDRWGEIVFESHDPDFGWDGTYHNQLCMDGVYVWKIIVKEKNKDKFHDFVGHVSLLR